ncbi:hypothetical protein Q7C36_000279 [Tachysurus vachellii]|uniref:Uncharacterized protein n=1 Tax=Tachysurus vachellii TaxID=175792 RepID=A0AA88P1G3_TACVA|nr:hypothetical protein Q7C36_000279 [Tachysurus vachellii]
MAHSSEQKRACGLSYKVSAYWIRAASCHNALLINPKPDAHHLHIHGYQSSLKNVLFIVFFLIIIIIIYSSPRRRHNVKKVDVLRHPCIRHIKDSWQSG